MGFKKYIVASFLFLAIIAGYVYSISSNEFTVKIVELGINQTLPIYVWIILPALFLFLATILHMIYYSTKGYLEQSSSKKDMEKLFLLIKDRLLKEKSSVMIKTPQLKEIGNILNQIDFEVKEDIKTSSDLINKTISTINKINNNNYIPTKELKLPANNLFVEKNIKNRVLSDDNFAIEVIKNSTNYSVEICELAFKQVLENKSIETVKKLIQNLQMTNTMVKELLNKDSKSPKELAFTNSEILKYIQDNKFTNSELITIAKSYKRTMSPEQLIKLFEDIAANNETLTTSYLYVLFEYEMIEQAREILVNSQKDEYVLFKAMLDLKDSGKHNYSFDTLVLQ